MRTGQRMDYGLLIGLGLTSAFRPIFHFLGVPRPQSPDPVPRFMKVGLSNCLSESKKGFAYPHKRCHRKVMLNSSTYTAELSFDKLDWGE